MITLKNVQSLEFIKTNFCMQPQPAEDLGGEKQTKTCRESILKVTKTIYYLNLVISLACATTLLILFPQLRQQLSITLSTIIIYGFMLIWLSIFNLIFVIINKEACAVWCNRVIAKFVIMIFPVFYILGLSRDKFLELFWVKVFLTYLLVVSGLLVVYELYSCTWGHHEQPSYIYEHNDIKPFAAEVETVRKQYELNSTKRKPNN